MKVIKRILIVIALGAVVFLFREPLGNFWALISNKYFPCQKPIAYSLGSFDKRFGISKEDFLANLRKAEDIWEKPIAKDLFVYSPDGSLKINLIYDERQESTITLQKLGLVVSDSKASYDSLKAKYDVLKVNYIKDKNTFELRLKAFQDRQDEYEKDVKYWNTRGGATKSEYDRLNEEKKWLDAEGASLNQMQEGLNKSVDELNALVVVLNRLAATLNLSVDKYNEIGITHSGEFEEGTYESGPDGQAINIYQFDDRGKLVRVLAHEFGHALGLEHLENTKAIMYRLNNGVNEKLTEDDLTALKKLCGIEK